MLHRSSGSEFQSARGASVASATNPFDDESDDDENSKWESKALFAVLFSFSEG